MKTECTGILASEDWTLGVGPGNTHQAAVSRRTRAHTLQEWNIKHHIRTSYYDPSSVQRAFYRGRKRVRGRSALRVEALTSTIWPPDSCILDFRYNANIPNALWKPSWQVRRRWRCFRQRLHSAGVVETHESHRKTLLNMIEAVVMGNL